MAAHLAGPGVSVFGADLSSKTVDPARHACPNLRFAEGTMTALETRDDELGGILARYSAPHTPPQWLPDAFAEFHRTLAPGGYLLWGDHVGDERPQPTHGCGRPVSDGFLCGAGLVTGLAVLGRGPGRPVLEVA